MARVYLSSTYSDLQEYRTSVLRSLRRMRHEVVAMEDYGATDQRPLDKCLADVESCGVYVGIFAWRYGYVPDRDNPNKLSITERELRFAKEKGRTCLIFMLHEDAPWPPSKMDQTEEGEDPTRIKTLRAQLGRDFTVDFFCDCDELASKVTTSIHNWERDLVRPVGESISELQRLMREPAVRDAVARFHADFSAACEQIEMVASYKDIHDQLHHLQFQCFDCLVRDADSFPQDETTRHSLSDYLLTLEEVVIRLKDIARDASLPLNDLAWIDEIACTQEMLQRAIDESDQKLLKETIWRLRRVLMVQPTRINLRLNSSARSLRLSTLASAMKSVSDPLARTEMDREKTSKLQSGVDALGALDTKLERLRDEHDGWQAAELELRRIENNIDSDSLELQLAWPGLKAMAEPLYNDYHEPWSIALRETASKLQSAVDTQNEREAKSIFHLFRRRAGDRFFRVDTMLKRLCGDLRLVGEPMAAMLRVMQ